MNEAEALEISEPNETFDMNEVSEYEKHSPYEYQPDETFETAENQSPLEAYSSHGGSSRVLRCVLYFTFLHAACAANLGRTNFCSMGDAPVGTDNADDLLHFLGLVVTVLCMSGF